MEEFLITPLFAFPNGEELYSMDSENKGTSGEFFLQNERGITYGVISMTKGKIEACKFLNQDLSEEEKKCFFDDLEFFKWFHIQLDHKVFHSFKDFHTREGENYHRDYKREILFMTSGTAVPVQEGDEESRASLIYTPGGVYPWVKVHIQKNELTDCFILGKYDEYSITTEHIKVLKEFCKEESVRPSEAVLKKFSWMKKCEGDLFSSSDRSENKPKLVCSAPKENLLKQVQAQNKK